MVAALTCVAERGALLGATVDLADKRIDIDDQTPVAGAGARPPRAREREAEHPVELADVPERERAQKRPQRRRRRHHMPEHRLRLPRTQHIAVIDAVRS